MDGICDGNMQMNDIILVVQKSDVDKSDKTESLFPF